MMDAKPSHLGPVLGPILWVIGKFGVTWFKARDLVSRWPGTFMASSIVALFVTWRWL
jgi:hypothetical protein